MIGSSVTEPGKAWDRQTLKGEEERAEREKKKRRLEDPRSFKILVQMTFKVWSRHTAGTSSTTSLFGSCWSAENDSTSPSCMSQGTKSWLVLSSPCSLVRVRGLPQPNWSPQALICLACDSAEHRASQEPIYRVRAETPILNLMF